MENEMKRLSTFFNISSSSKVRPGTLARFGFYYVTHILSIVCHGCQFTLKEFEYTNDVDKKHRNLSPDCKYVIQNSETNSASGGNKENQQCDYSTKGDPQQQCLSKMLDNSKIFKNCEEFFETVQSVSSRQEKAFEQMTRELKNSKGAFSNQVGNGDKGGDWRDVTDRAPARHETDDLSGLPQGSQSTMVPDHSLPNNQPRVNKAVPAAYKLKHPEYADIQKRWDSFAGKPNIPNYRYANPRCLGEAGFYLQGPADNVRCFCCDGGLKNFQPDDDPWREHARWFPRCFYLCEHKDQEYIQAAELPSQTDIPKSNAAGNGANGRFYVDPREVKARMESPTTKVILDMGYSRDLVRQALEQQLMKNGDDFINVQSLLEAMFALEEANRSAAAIKNSSTKADSTAAQAPLSQAPVCDPSPVAITANDTAKTCSSSSSTSEDNPSALATKTKKQKKNKSKINNDSSAGAVGGAAPIDEDIAGIMDTETKSLLDENGKLREARQCKVCLDKEVDIVFLPCGHLVCCNTCAPELKNCPVCRALIRGTVRVFLT